MGSWILPTGCWILDGEEVTKPRIRHPSRPLLSSDGGRKVQPGQLIHADKHGFLVVPAEDETRLLEAARFMDSNECQTLIPAARGAAGKPFEQVLAEIDSAGAAFGKAAREQFGRQGEW